MKNNILSSMVLIGVAASTLVGATENTDTSGKRQVEYIINESAQKIKPWMSLKSIRKSIISLDFTQAVITPKEPSEESVNFAKTIVIFPIVVDFSTGKFCREGETQELHVTMPNQQFVGKEPGTKDQVSPSFFRTTFGASYEIFKQEVRLNIIQDDNREECPLFGLWLTLKFVNDTEALAEGSLEVNGRLFAPDDYHQYESKISNIKVKTTRIK